MGVLLLNDRSIHRFIADIQFLTFKILGMVPASYCHLSSIQINHSIFMNIFNLRFIPSYQSILIFTLLGFNFSQIATEPIISPNSSRFTRILIIFLRNCVFISETVILIMYYRERRDLRKTIQKFINFTVGEINFKRFYEYRNIKYRSYFFFFMYFGITINIICFIAIEGPADLRTAATSIGCIIISWFTLQYGIILNLILDRFKVINRTIQKCSTTTQKNLANGVITPILQKFNSFRCNTCLFHILRAHEIMYEICHRVSRFYSMPIFFAISTTSFSIILTSYFTFIRFIEPNVVSVFMTWGTVSWLVIDIFPIICLTITVTRIIYEMEKTMSTVYGLTKCCIAGQYFKLEVHQFLLTLLHRKVNFTAFDILKLDGTLLQAILGMMITYLVILLQFYSRESK